MKDRLVKDPLFKGVPANEANIIAEQIKNIIIRARVKAMNGLSCQSGMPSAQTYINPDGDFVDSHAVARCQVKESWHFSTPSKSPTQSTRR